MPSQNLNRGGLPSLGGLSFLDAVIQGAEAADYFIRKIDAYEKEQRYDDNCKKLIVQATRLFESGQISKAQLKAMIDLLPDTVNTQAKPIEAIPASQGNDLSSLLNSIDPAMLSQLLTMLK